MMRRHRLRILIATVVLLGSAAGLSAAESIWAKGNTHTHTTISDGNASPEEVVKWYKDHGYQFLVLSDHDRMAPLEFFDKHTDANFILIPGIELSVLSKRGNHSIHINAIGNRSPLTAIRRSQAAEALFQNIEQIRKAGAIAQINHPSFHLKDRDAANALTGTLLMETYNHSSRADEMASLHQPIFEAGWDVALTAGKRVWGVAADDTHDYKTFGPKHANPGGAWIRARVAKLTQEEILKSLLAGEFYASTGVEIAEHEFDGKSVRVGVTPKAGVTYSILFIGREGMPLKKLSGPTAEYRLSGNPREAYVRVRVDASDATKAWAQPVWPGSAK